MHLFALMHQAQVESRYDKELIGIINDLRGKCARARALGGTIYWSRPLSRGVVDWIAGNGFRLDQRPNEVGYRFLVFFDGIPLRPPDTTSSVLPPDFCIRLSNTSST